MTDSWARLIEQEDEIDRSRDTVRRLNRRCQRAESETARVRRESIGMRRRGDHWKAIAVELGYAPDPVEMELRQIAREMRVKRNAVRCLHCNTVVESMHHHDFRRCPCGHVAVDGGRDYLKRLWTGEPNWNEIDERGVETRTTIGGTYEQP